MRQSRGPADTDLIFVSIAAYRDPQLGPTIGDCLAKATHPERLRFGICWQHGPDEAPLAIFDDDRFVVLDIDWRDSRGACWARAEIMKLWSGQHWYLQLDSHHRFAEGWDEILLTQAAATGSPKPVLTTYAHPFAPDEAGPFGPEPMLMEFDRFTDDGIVLFRPGAIRTKSSGRPVRGRFASAHFLFAPGSFVTDVPYDPDLYFIGEEITLAVRAFTHGYDLFHPSVPVVWHEYTRNGRSKHWDDHTSANGVQLNWSERDVASRIKIRDLLTDPHIGEFGCGTERSFTEYENYAGLNFRHRRAQDYTRHHGEPPGPPVRPDWVARTRDHKVSVVFDAEHLPAPARDHPQFWAITFADAHGREIHRADADLDEVIGLLADSPDEFVLHRIFESTAAPATWTVIPVDARDQWFEAITGRVDLESTDDIEAPTPLEQPTPVGLGRPIQRPNRAARADWLDRLDGFPLAEADLILTQTPDGFEAIRPGSSHAGYKLNDTGVLLFELANGRYSLAEIISVVTDTFSLNTPPESEIRKFYIHAAQAGLVHEATKSRKRYVHG
jgi:hypothetical protein